MSGRPPWFLSESNNIELWGSSTAERTVAEDLGVEADALGLAWKLHLLEAKAGGQK